MFNIEFLVRLSLINLPLAISLSKTLIDWKFIVYLFALHVASAHQVDPSSSIDSLQRLFETFSFVGRDGGRRHSCY